MLEELVKHALVGTSRGAAEIPRADGALGEALTTLDAGSAESKLLAAGAVLSQYETCGRASASAASNVAPAAPDSKPACSGRAGDLLAMVLSMQMSAAKKSLVGEWVELANAAKQRVPHRLLPQLLDYGAANRALREPISKAADARGAWLMSLNPRWQFAAGEQVDYRALWETGTPEQRASAIRKMRETDPAGALELISSTWKQDGADERTKFVEAMRVSLSPADEPFLESALDDRSKQVRAAAADLLARLPESTFVKRMIERAEPLLKFTSGVVGGILRRSKPATLDAYLPPEHFAPSWARDGITEKPEERMGQRQWWLVQVLSNVPPQHWSAKWNAEPEEIVPAALGGEHGDKLLQALTTATWRHPDVKWVSAVLRASAQRATNPSQAQRAVPVDLLKELPVAHRVPILAEILESPKAGFESVAQWLAAADFPFDQQIAGVAIDLIERHVAKTKGYDYYLAHLLEHLALVLPPLLHDDLANRWVSAAWEDNRSTLDKFLQTLSLRREIHREFKP